MRLPRFLSGAALALLMTIPLVAAAPAFAADGGENELTKTIISKLENSSDDIVVIEPAQLSNQDLIEDKYFGNYTSIVVLKPEALGSYDPKEFSDFIAQEHGGGYATTLSILVLDGSSSDTVYVSSPTTQLEASVKHLLGEQEADGSIKVNDAGWEILRHSDEIYELQKGVQQQSNLPLWAILLIFPGSFVLIPLLVWGVYTLITKGKKAARRRRYRRSQIKLNKQDSKERARRAKEEAKAARAKAAEEERERREREANAAPVTDKMKSHLEELRLAQEELKQEDSELANAIGVTVERFTELRESLGLMEASKVKRDILYLEYEEIFSQLVTLLGPKYYRDIKRNPTHWREPEKKLSAIRASFYSTANQILESIIQLKEGSEFDFQFSIDRILGFNIVQPKDMLGE